MSNENKKLFYPCYADGEYNANGQYGGQFKQKGAVYIDVTYGYTYQQFLRYYYDYATNSNYPVGNGGQIIFHASHTGAWAILNNSVHYRICTTCGFYQTEAHQWESYGSGTQQRCATCGKIVAQGGGTQNSDDLNQLQ